MKTIDEQKKEFEKIVGDRIKFEKQTSDWVVYSVRVSSMTICKTIEIRDIYIRIFKKVLDELLNTYYTNKINKGAY